MRKNFLRFSQVAIDLGVLTLAFLFAFFLRFDWVPPTEMVARLTLTIPYVVLGGYAVLWALSVPRFAWRYVGLREVSRIFIASVIITAGLVSLHIVFNRLQYTYGYFRHGIIPLGVILINGVLVATGVIGVRVLRRVLGEKLDQQRAQSRHKSRAENVPTMLIGAGQYGAIMAKELQQRHDLGLMPIGFLDDDPAKQGSVIAGLPVLGPTAELAKWCADRSAQQVLVTVANISGTRVREIKALSESIGLPIKIVPGLYELADGAVNVSRIRDVAIEDLLRRDAIELDLQSIFDLVKGKTVLVTGAGGSIGSELCRQLLRFRPKQLVLFEQAENSLFQIHRELSATLKQTSSDTVLAPVVGDIVDQMRVHRTFDRFKPTIVFHAAAHKHVPLMEENPDEALRNNVFGTRSVAMAAHNHGVSRFVMISTDKAVNPSSVMGATKRMAEMVVQSLAAESDTRFATVRFGNVLGSAGSVIPIFQEQIAQGGPVTVTHPEMRRYFMTIPEACQLVLQAGALGQGGEIFILDMGEPVRIVDLARDLIEISGLRAGEDIEIRFTGVRPGEKLFEELATDSEKADQTQHPKIFVGRTRNPGKTTVDGWVVQLEKVLNAYREPRELIQFMQRCVPEFNATNPAYLDVAPVRSNLVGDSSQLPGEGAPATSPVGRLAASLRVSHEAE